MNNKPGIKLIAESEGTGPPVQKGQQVTVRLNGWLNRGDHIQKDVVCDICVGGRSVIPGIEYSIMGMRRGGIRKVKISPHLAYRETGIKGCIPPNAVLTYQIELIKIHSDSESARFLNAD